MADQRIRDGDTFCRLKVSGEEDLLVDLALEELAGRKLLALFYRAEARDFSDVFVLAERYRVELILKRAAQIDAGFDPRILATIAWLPGTLRRPRLPHCRSNPSPANSWPST